MSLSYSHGEIPYITPISSHSDPKQYRSFVIPQNMLRVLLISDVNSPSSAAAMTCGVGNLCDPHIFTSLDPTTRGEDGHYQPLLGLTHLLEHMLFLGTTKYPNEGEYKYIVNKHGGTRNASTSSETTTYQFEAPSTHFIDILDRFAQFFISPLLNKECLMREMKVVNSEHNKNIVADSRRSHALLRMAIQPNHPCM